MFQEFNRWDLIYCNFLVKNCFGFMGFSQPCALIKTR